ncbi:MAG: nuclear transport factor 2 family protein [Aquihabitans sp.]
MNPLVPRLERLEAIEAIRQLVARHALATDQRDIDTLVSLYVPDVAVDDGTSGRSMLAGWFRTALGRYGTTFHLLGQHLIDLSDADHATGVLYARPEYEVDERWMVLAAQYWDHYERHDGTWLLSRRETHAFYAADITDHPLQIDGRTSFPPEVHRATIDLPERFPTWQHAHGAGPSIGSAEGRG